MSASAMPSLQLTGGVSAGAGRFREELKLPEDLLSGQRWMSEFVQGTLNIQFYRDQLPEDFRADGMKTLDLNRRFPPAVYRPGHHIPNNTIRPSLRSPQKGDVQMWRAMLVRKADNRCHRCYVIRRVGSGYEDVVELLGARNFRQAFGFRDRELVSLTIYPS